MLRFLIGGAHALLLSVLFAEPARCAGVSVALEASFGQPPYLLELLETAAQENPSTYYPLLDRIADGYFAELTTEKELYERFLTLLKDEGHISSPEALSTFQLALSLHAAAPRIEAHYQYYKTSIDPILTKAQDASCPVWVHFNGKQYCSPTLERAQQDFDGPNEDDLPFDRSIRVHDELPVATLYVDINSPLFEYFHRTLSASAKAGKSVYRLRYRPSLVEVSQPLRASGYGVELQLKRTDYIVIDDREADESTVLDLKPTTDKDLEEVADLKPLSASELRGLGLKTSSYILGSEDPFASLERISQDFPKYSSSISHLNITPDFLAEHEANRETFLPVGLNVLWMNGLQIAWRQMDAFGLLDRLRQERSFVYSLQGVGLSAPEAIALIGADAVSESRSSADVQRYDWRDANEGGKVIVWLNDIEKDSRYADWPSHASALLQRAYPGQMPSVRRDIHNLVVPVDLSSIEGIEMAAETLFTLVQRKLPLRFGFVPMSRSPLADQQARVTYYLRETYGIGTAIAYLRAVGESKAFLKTSQQIFETSIQDRKPRKGNEVLSLDEVLNGPQMEERILQSKLYLSRLGATTEAAPAFVNGVPVTQNEQWLQSVSQRLSADLQKLAQKVYTEVVPEDTWLAGEFLTEVSLRRNPLIVPEDEDDIEMLDIGKIFSEHDSLISSLPFMAADEGTTVADWIQIILIADFDNPEGNSMMKALDTLKLSKSSPGAEIWLIHNPEGSSVGEESIELFKMIPQYAQDEFDTTLALEERAGLYWEKFRPIVKSLEFEPGATGVVVNGRRLGPTTEESALNSEDIRELLKYERKKRIEPVVTALRNLTLAEKIKSPQDLATVSALVTLSAIPDVPQGIYDNSGAVRMDAFKGWQSRYTSITRGDIQTATVQVIGSIDPTSEIAQRWIPIVKALSELDGVFVQIFLNPRPNLQELPVKRFYRYVLDSKPKFSENGELLSAGARFEGVPVDALLNLGMDVPPAWLVSAKDSIYDLDNLKLSAIKTGEVNAIYELEYILIEGHSTDLSSGTPPRGVQLLLGTEHNPRTADTLIMANLGYFQFKANPGYWNIQLKAGRSADIFEIDSLGSRGETDHAQSTQVTLMSWQGKTLFPKLSRKPGKELEDVLEEPAVASAGDFFAKAKAFGQSILSKTGAVAVRKHADINIFSVASGHLYERMLNIMMVSVMKNTQHTVKFWFIEQFLSPSFKSSIPHLAEAYGFEYELVTYKWPHWLRSQKEKQREIWGYKILFLDVLFPLDLEKVIFVDSDQTVRTDMYELVKHDLEGAPYGFTPMCDSRTEMEGFRFWKQGYWQNFLRGRPYHISALYVVDLQRFRQLAAGDRLRQQYHQLSADPNSLSNLDQDLPNNMQFQLPIHSLPQEWLWCETWCSDESLKDARTIDLCNNPMTKEPKLDRARRQVPEWTVYDDEIAEVFRQVREKQGGGIELADSARIQEELDIEQKKKFDEEKKQEESAKSSIKEEL